MPANRKKKNGVEIDLKASKMSVEQALRELKMIMNDDIEKAKERRYYEKPSKERREREKVRKANIRRYSKYN